MAWDRTAQDRHAVRAPFLCSLYVLGTVGCPDGSRSEPQGAVLMVRRAGSADLPLHGGRVPAWLGQRMTRLGAVIVEAIVLEYGRDELLRRLAHPYWFQSLGAV